MRHPTPVARHPASLAALILAPSLALAPAPAAAGVIDTFESGAFSATRSVPGVDSISQQPNAGHCIDDERILHLQYSSGSTGTMSAGLVPLDGEDDAIVLTLPVGYGVFSLVYEGGPWDLTEGGASNRITVAVGDVDPGAFLEVQLETASGFDQDIAVLSGAGSYHFAFSELEDVDVTAIERIWVTVYGHTGQSTAIRSIRTTSGSGTTMIYRAWDPRMLTLMCVGAEDRLRGGEQRLGWDWAVDWPSAPGLAGPNFEVLHLSAPGCVNVAFEASPAETGDFGPMGMVTVDWLAPTFTSASFELRFATDPGAPYTAQHVGDPQLAVLGEALVLTYDLEIFGAPGIPDGTVRQEVVLAVHPSQGANFTFGEVYPELVEGVGYVLQFVLAGGTYTPSSPLFEVFTSAAYADFAGATGILPPVAAPGGVALLAHPSVTRSGVRFVLPRGAPANAAIDVFDVAGRRVRTLAVAAGEARWDGTRADGSTVPAGVYFGKTAFSDRAARVVMLR